ncbi:MAG: 4-phosphopantetheinyl transferase [Rhodanobacteraceae bacterium]
MIGPQDFAAADPRDLAPRLADAIHLWRLPYRHEQGRAPLRALLADYLNVDAASLTLREDAHGKPRLLGQDARDLQFNWSHSGGFAVVAITRDLEVGVDIEQARTLRALELSRRFFSVEEAEALARCDEAVCEQSFLQLWCAKEAVLKALGRGLAFGLRRVEFAREANQWRPLRFEAEAGPVAGWQVLPVVPATGCCGALAWRGRSRSVLAWSIARRA